MHERSFLMLKLINDKHKRIEIDYEKTSKYAIKFEKLSKGKKISLMNGSYQIIHRLMRILGYITHVTYEHRSQKILFLLHLRWKSVC